VRTARTAAEVEIQQLQATIREMRSAVDAARIAHQQDSQASQLAAQAEIGELRAMVRHLREEAETQLRQREQAVDELSRSQSRDIVQLQDTIIALRAALEAHGR
jgi:chromosome segregation ATPase